jgi:hypothetical protein
MKNRLNSVGMDSPGNTFILELLKKTPRQVMGSPAVSAENHDKWVGESFNIRSILKLSFCSNI